MQAHTPMFGCMFNGIIDQVIEHTFYHADISGHVWDGFVDIDIQPDVFLSSAQMKFLRHIKRQLGQGKQLLLGPHFVSIQFGQLK